MYAAYRPGEIDQKRVETDGIKNGVEGGRPSNERQLSPREKRRERRRANILRPTTTCPTEGLREGEQEVGARAIEISIVDQGRPSETRDGEKRGRTDLAGRRRELWIPSVKGDEGGGEKDCGQSLDDLGTPECTRPVERVPPLVVPSSPSSSPSTGMRPTGRFLKDCEPARGYWD